VIKPIVNVFWTDGPVEVGWVVVGAEVVGAEVVGALVVGAEVVGAVVEVSAAGPHPVKIMPITRRISKGSRNSFFTFTSFIICLLCG
jgi:hypothetical protein